MYYTLFVILIVLASILMIGIVLIQESKGGGLSSGFSSGNTVFGVRKTTDVIEKTTWGLAAAMVIISIFCAYTAPKSTTEQSVLEGSAPQTEQSNPANTPGFGASEAPKTDAAAPATDAKADAKAEAAPADAKEKPAKEAKDAKEAPAAAETEAPAEK